MSDLQAVVYGFMSAALIGCLVVEVKSHIADRLRHVTVTKGEIVGGL